MQTIDNTQDVMDSRDIIARIEELESEISDNETEVSEGSLDENNEALKELQTELASLKKLADQCEGNGDWQYGEALVRESYFTQHTQELIDDCYEIKQSSEWPYRHMTLDIEAAAEELKQDYTEVDFEGVTYYLRS